MKGELNAKTCLVKTELKYINCIVSEVSGKNTLIKFKLFQPFTNF